jgi:hypothetical protein
LKAILARAGTADAAAGTADAAEGWDGAEPGSWEVGTLNAEPTHEYALVDGAIAESW